jgi:hypothetical protein
VELMTSWRSTTSLTWVAPRPSATASGCRLLALLAGEAW